MTLSNGIHLLELSEFEWIADHSHDRTFQSQDIMKTASTVSGAVVDPGKFRVL